MGLAGRSQAAYRGAILQPQAPGFSCGVLTLLDFKFQRPGQALAGLREKKSIAPKPTPMAYGISTARGRALCRPVARK